MKGSLQVKGKKWYVVLSYKDENTGKENRKWIATGLDEKGNKRKAKEMMDEILNEVSQKGVKAIESKELLFDEYLLNWLPTNKHRLEEITFHSYTNYTKRICRYFKSKKITLSELKPIDIQQFYGYLSDKGLTGNSLQHYHTILKRSLKDAVKNGLLDKNIMDYVDRPKKQKFVSEFYNKNEIMKLFEIIKDDPLELIIHIAIYYGMRRSEIVGLKWSNIDFENKIIKVSHKVVDVNGVLYAKNTMKNKSSNRTLPLVEHIEKLLINEKKQQEKNRAMFGKGYCNQYNDYVCVNAIGELIKPDYITHHFKDLLERHNMKHIRFHDLRHSCASLMLANGVQMKEIQNWLGHSTYVVTADTYLHLDFSSKINSANTISNVLDNNIPTNNINIDSLGIDEFRETLSDKEKQQENNSNDRFDELNDEIAKLKLLLEEKENTIKRLKKQSDMEM